RTKDLFLRDAHVRRYVGEHGWLDKIPARIIALGQAFTAAGERSAVFILPDVDVAHDFFHGIGVDYRAHISSGVSAVTDPERFSTFHQLLRKLFVNFLVDHQPRRCSAALAGS